MLPDNFHFDPLSIEFSADPYAIYKQLRDSGESYYFEPQDMWLLSRYEDVSSIATNPAMVRSLEGLASVEELKERKVMANWHDMPYHERVVQFSLLDSDGPTHRRLRKLVFGAFQGRAISALEGMVQAYVDGLFDQLDGKAEIDFIADFAVHIPGHVIGQFLGVPAEDCPQLRLWSEQVVQFFDVDRSDEKKQTAETAAREFYHYLLVLKEERLTAPRDDLISKMIADEAQGYYLNQDEFISTCMLILMAGHGSTIDVLGSGMHLLLKHPETIARLRMEPDLLPTAIQEMFRFEPPLPFFHRHATQDVTVAGKTFEKGTTFGLLYGAANRDEATFEDADQFIIGRTPNRHLAFGQGAHLCLGNHLARMNMKIIFETLLKRFGAIELATKTISYKPGLSVRGPSNLPIQWR